MFGSETLSLSDTDRLEMTGAPKLPHPLLCRLCQEPSGGVWRQSRTVEFRYATVSLHVSLIVRLLTAEDVVVH